jgi:hypothetical protein
MRSVFAATLLFACAQPAPQAVSIAAPLPTVSQSSASLPEPHPVAKPTTDDGDFSSERGMVHLTAEPDGSLAGAYPNGILTCEPKQGALACRWYERTSDGHITFHRRQDGRLESDDGTWTLTPIVRAGSLDGVWDTNWTSAVITTKTGGLHVDYADGTMECTERDRKLTCTWSEGALSGGAELTIESQRVIRGRWGSGTSSTDGGSWVFVRR